MAYEGVSQLSKEGRGLLRRSLNGAIKYWQWRGNLLHTPSLRVGSGRNKPTSGPILFMSQHRSLRAAATLGGKRNVLKRFERLEILKKRGQWKEGDRITGLRKTKADA